ncbi:hypothetical protein PIB30_021116 [Stylosanthes scabra]|uniref:Uncharacterized protein n=1 Tax=Stylosanthes scabra TaxID=79078 RepID=A0ABU6Z7B9_9FABA|nr:hypothetical protein [Stylosanthes scabra]
MQLVREVTYAATQHKSTSTRRKFPYVEEKTSPQSTAASNRKEDAFSINMTVRSYHQIHPSTCSKEDRWTFKLWAYQKADFNVPYVTLFKKALSKVDLVYDEPDKIFSNE